MRKAYSKSSLTIHVKTPPPKFISHPNRDTRSQAPAFRTWQRNEKEKGMLTIALGEKKYKIMTVENCHLGEAYDDHWSRQMIAC